MSRRTKVSDLPLTFETFQRLGRSDARSLQQDTPSVFNGWVKIRKHRVTFELIDEPAEVLHERLRELWRRCDNIHHRQPLRDAAAAHGITLDPLQCGVDAPKEYP